VSDLRFASGGRVVVVSRETLAYVRRALGTLESGRDLLARIDAYPEADEPRIELSDEETGLVVAAAGIALQPGLPETVREELHALRHLLD
jgi:hypothetical protein